jgi:anaerobic glycerol-3-phosphate dehydrogenase
MAVVTQFGALFVDDRIALERWLFAHDSRHTMYTKRYRANCRSLRGPVNGNWMLHHSLAHEALATAMKDSRASSRLLAMPDKWRTHEELATWHALHDQLHKFIEGVMAHGG